MATKTNRTLLIWLIVILLATNISTIATIFYHVYFQERKLPDVPGRELRIPDGHMGRFFRDEMNLTPKQHRQFRDFRHDFHSKANGITIRMQENRNALFDELARENPDTVHLGQLADEIGELHAQLKGLTFEYYLQLKSVCDPQQQKKLHFIFSKMMNDERAGMKMPKRINPNN
ncbi:MAG: periplasmic heavy metal sensor [Bacteroidetes bacterium]|jgi:Spy/CpxP family protein refolding chaperone|nr:periplasmic heavy metal sensor [Bacteroidota bacterium]